MDYTPEKREFYNWVKSIDINTLSETDIKLINIIIDNFDDISKVGTAKGLRATLIGELIKKHKKGISTELPDLSDYGVDSDIATNIYELNIGPFRGFINNETFLFNKKYTFIYGPNK